MTLFDSDDAYMKIRTFAVQDLNGDGSAEVILTVLGSAGDAGDAGDSTMFSLFQNPPSWYARAIMYDGS